MTRISTAFALGAAALWLAGCGGGAATTGAPSQPAAETALAASARGELLTYVKEKLRAREAARASGSGIGLDLIAPPPGWLATVTTAGGTLEQSTTLVQEQGVDEEDLLKSDGSVIVTLVPSRGSLAGSAFARLQVYRRAGDGTVQDASRLELTAPDNSYTVVHGMYHAAEQQRVAVLGESSSFSIGLPDCGVGEVCITALPYTPLRSSVQLQLVDVADPARATVRERLVIDGRLVGSRRIGRMLYLVTSHTPQFAPERLPATATPAEREAALARLSTEDFLPRVSVNGGAPQPLVLDTQCYTQPRNASLDLSVTTITAVDLASPNAAATSRCFVGGTEALYMSASNLYLATTRYEVQPATAGQAAPRFAPEARTDIHKFAIEGALVSYRASGDVAGHLGWDRQKSSYRMGEHNGDLRVLTFTGQRGWATPLDAQNGTVAPSPATLTILRERTSDRTLQPLATLPNAQRPALLGKPGEQVYGVRFLGDRAYLVTFRTVDPLYVLDLSNPADPRAAGELEMPGFSDYLYPLPNGMLLGVGKDASAEGRLGGVKVALIDVSDPARPRLLQSQVYGERGTYSGLDASRHGLNMLVSGDAARIALPLAITASGGRAVEHGLQRIEVDTRAGTMRSKPLIAGASASGWVDLSTERSLQIGAKLYYLTQGALAVHDW